MFDTLSDRLEGVFKKLRGQGRITERNIDEALREVRLALLEADVNIQASSAISSTTSRKRRSARRCCARSHPSST